MKKIFTALLLVCLLSFTSCLFYNFDPKSEPSIYDRAWITIYNYSDSAIYVYMKDGVADSLPLSPGLELFIKSKTETTNKFGNAIFHPIVSPEYRINAFGYGDLIIDGDCDNPKLPCGKQEVTLFFIKDKTMRNYSWAQIHEKQLYESKIVITESELKSKCWSISYISPKLIDDKGEIIIPFYGYYSQ